MRLSDCEPGQGGRVVQVSGNGPASQRLMEMGMIEGAEVEVIRVAPFGGPMQVRLDDYRISLRRTEAEGVEIAG